MSVVSQRAGPHLLAQGEAPRLLFVDGDPILCEFAATNLAAEGISVETALDAEAAMASIRAARPDVLMIEASIAGLDGLALVAALRADPRLAGLPVVVVAGREDIDAVGRAYEAGADGFAVKPLNWRLLAHQVRFVRRGGDRAGAIAEQLSRLASAGAQFIAGALARDPSLKAAASAFANAVDAVIKPQGRADAA